MTDEAQDSTPRSAGDIMDVAHAADDLLAFGDGGERFGTGYSIDRSCGRMGAGELGLLWARSSTGKSTLLLNIIMRTPAVPTIVFSMEMTARKQLEWLTCMAHNLPVHARDIPELSPRNPHYEPFRAALDSMPRKFPHLHFVHPSQSPTVADFARFSDTVFESTGVVPVRVFVDHLTLMANCRDYEGVTRTAAALHSWSLRDALAVTVVQQTGRSGGADLGRNDGHIPVTLSSGVYAGEHDADWIYGLYRPEKDPRFQKAPHEFRKHDEYERAQTEYERVKGVTRLQVVKNRPFATLAEHGVELRYDAHTRRLYEPHDDITNMLPTDIDPEEPE